MDMHKQTLLLNLYNLASIISIRNDDKLCKGFCDFVLEIESDFLTITEKCVITEAAEGKYWNL